MPVTFSHQFELKERVQKDALRPSEKRQLSGARTVFYRKFKSEPCGTTHVCIHHIGKKVYIPKSFFLKKRKKEAED